MTDATTTICRHAGVAMGALLVGFMLTAPAGAQQLGRLTKPTVQETATPSPKIAPPPALPGSKTAESAVAPAEHPGLDMAPNDALFDSINRGDLAGAKDAISRGADLSARNVLGLRPLELSVDLGRNEISFLLLSLRGADSAVPRVASAPVAAAPAKEARAVRTRVAPQPREVVAAPVAQRNPQLFAGNGGAAVPQAGFLGFGGAR
jgi:hypothetical protein